MCAGSSDAHGRARRARLFSALRQIEPRADRALECARKIAEIRGGLLAFETAGVMRAEDEKRGRRVAPDAEAERSKALALCAAGPEQQLAATRKNRTGALASEHGTRR